MEEYKPNPTRSGGGGITGRKSNPTRSGEVLADRVGYRKLNPARWGDFLMVKVGFGKLMVR